MRVSVVLCTYAMSMYDEFREAAESVLSQTYNDVELVVVVDGTEPVYERVRDEYGKHDDVVIHCNAENRGLLESRNTGAELASGNVVAFIDDDAVADEHWVAELTKRYEARDVRAVGGRMVPKWVAGKPGFLPEEFYWLVGVTHAGFADGEGYVRNTFGSNISFDREVFLELGGFDASMGGRKGDENLQGGETELCARLRDRYGGGVWYVPSATVAHKVYDYRTDPKWLLDRAFWQGYSKRAMEVLIDDEGGEEGDFLAYLLTTATPRRLKGLVGTPSTTKALQLVMVYVFTAVVAAGYLYGFTEWQTSNGSASANERDVCVVTHPLSSSGENATRTLLDVLSTISAVSLVTADLPTDSSMRDEYEIVEISSKSAGDSVPVAAARFLGNQLRMCRVIAGREEDIVLFFGATSYLLPVLAARLYGKTILIEPRGDVPLTLRLAWETRLPSPVAKLLAGSVRALERTSFRSATAVVTYTPGMARQLGLDPDSPDVYPEGARYVDIDRFSPTVPYEERELVVGFLGRLDEEKGIRELAEVARALSEDITFRFIGDGELQPWLEAELAEEIERGSVELAGWVDHDDVPEELTRLRLVLMPSQPTEGLPTTILEALACGTPVYATPVSGIPDVVRPGETGFLMQSRNPAEIHRDLEEILSRNDLQNVSTNCRTLAEQEYSHAAAVDRYRSILRSVLEG